MDGFYEAYFLTPGPAIPLNWIRTLPAWTMEEYLGQTIWQWIFLFVIIALVLGFLFFVYWLTSLYVGKRNSIAANMILLLRPIITICLLLFSVSFLDEQIFLTGEVLQVIVFIVNIIVLYCSIAITLVLSKILASSNIFLKGSKQGEVNQHLVSIGIRLIGIAVAIIILIHGLHKLGFSLATILTGASVTGLALALAAQSTLKNIFGSIMLLVDEPFVVGDRIKIDKHDGYVEEIGLRSTRLRTVLGNLVTIPNEELASADIENITKRKYVRRKFNVTITYNTPPEKVKRAIFILKEILSVPENILEQKQNALQKKDKKALKELDHPNMRIVSQEHPVQVFFNDFNADSLNLIVYYWFKTEDYWEYLQHAQWVNQQILERFNDEKIEFAFPTQTIFLEQDKSL